MLNAQFGRFHCFIRLLKGCQSAQFYRIKGGGGSGRPSPPPIIVERQILPQQTIYRWKGNLTASRIHFKYWKNILILRFYEQFSRNDSAMAPERLFKKNFKLLKYEHIIHHFKAWRFRIYNYFHEIFKFRENIRKTDFAKFLKLFIKSRNLNISRK